MSPSTRRAEARDSLRSMSARSPAASGSSGVGLTSSRASLIAS